MQMICAAWGTAAAGAAAATVTKRRSRSKGRNRAETTEHNRHITTLSLAGNAVHIKLQLLLGNFCTSYCSCCCFCYSYCAAGNARMYLCICKCLIDFVASGARACAAPGRTRRMRVFGWGSLAWLLVQWQWGHSIDLHMWSPNKLCN